MVPCNIGKKQCHISRKQHFHTMTSESINVSHPSESDARKFISTANRAIDMNTMHYKQMLYLIIVSLINVNTYMIICILSQILYYLKLAKFYVYISIYIFSIIVIIWTGVSVKPQYACVNERKGLSAIAQSVWFNLSLKVIEYMVKTHHSNGDVKTRFWLKARLNNCKKCGCKTNL